MVKTLHERNEGNYSEGVDAFQVGGDKEEKVIEVEADSDEGSEISEMSKLSKGELLEQLRTLRAKEKASAANENDEESSQESSDDEGSSQEEGSVQEILKPSDGSHSSMSSAEGG